ncbi:MAG: type II secretion system secretin GspD [Hylemonella sp.]|uniref:type II secretion system secretin GspD n=1 Tax=Hylemonella sp. TaxID=2066020 RepID=UPI0022BCABA0|nr:type II secretion system secretin GspD [Hylemonella sp.]MCZ8252320.1 type II secretion system secretin GspD [Hylemonella sp.]
MHPLAVSRLCRALVLGLWLLGPAMPLHAQPAEGRNAPVTLNFVNAEIEAVARAMASITGRQLVVDPRVKGTMNLSSELPLPPMVAYNHFLATLRLQGYTVVESGGLYKVVPESEAKLQGSVVTAGPVAPAGNQIVTQIFKLNHELAANLVPVLRPLISPNNTVNVNPGTNALIITDYADNLQRLGRIIAANDVAGAAQIEMLVLRHATATDLAPLVTRLLESGAGPTAGQGQVDTLYKTVVLAEPRSNALIVRAANPARVQLVQALVAKLDQPTQQGEGGNGNIYVVYLRNADAGKLAVTLRAVLAGEVRAPASTSPSAAAAPSAQVVPLGTTTGGQVQADLATNSLIITAPEPQYRQLRAVIDKLDARRAQVFVESLIAEVNADKAAEFGIQWQGPIGRAGDANIGLIGTNFGAGGSNIITLATQAATGGVVPSRGLNVGVATQHNGIYVLGFLARFLEQNGDGNILSTPNLLTLDNEEAKIVIGQNVPFVTGQYTNNNVGASGTVNPFQTIERKDVGLTLRVKPQISENGSIKLAIFQEVSSVQASSLNSPSGLITNKRSIESNVLVDDGAIVVLGGLLQDEYAGNQERVPGLADLPLIGGLFRSETRARKKTNLMVFLRPVVIRDAAAAEDLSMGRYDQMRAAQQAVQPAASAVLPIQAGPLLPPRDDPSAYPGESPGNPLPSR